MKCPVCGDVRRESASQCFHSAESARPESPRWAFASERRITVLLSLVLLTGLISLAYFGPYRSGVPMVSVLQGRHPISSGTRNASAIGPQDVESQAAKQDAQGDQASDE